jgi:SAM-dependent methyltransferase
MHPEAIEFMTFVKNMKPEFFIEKQVLDVGSGDINGNNRIYFENCEYYGNDVIEANNVTIVSKTKDLPFPENTFDTIVSTECFEHDPEYKQSLLKIYNILKPNGLFCFTCASTGRAEHGTKNSNPIDSYGTIGNIENMSDYYKNLTEIDLFEVLDLNELFTVWDTYYNSESFDLYFIGIKKGDLPFEKLEKYVNPFVESTSKNIETLDVIFSKHHTDKNKYFHNYTRQYEALFQKYLQKPIKILEIGVFNGHSIKAFRDAFKNATCILGLDISPSCKSFEDVDNHIFIEIGDATDIHFIENITNKYGAFDIILDDGSHINRDIIQSFEILFPLLNDNGLYVVEDTVCYKKNDYINNNYPNHLEYFFKYTSFLNQWRYDSTEGIKDNCIDPFKIQKKTSNVFEYSIDKIEYGCSYIAISKKIRTHWL